MTGPKLEEGEACYYKDDASIDPDIVLSYIDEKLQNVLGHFQKDFEGGVSAENLGAKFGGYGSFLPMHQLSRTTQSHPKTPLRPQDNGTLKSPNNSHLEGVLQNSLVPAQVGAKVPVKHEPSSIKPVKQVDLKTFRVRIKMGSDNAAAQKNAAIYSGLGLTSPSSSMGHSPGESCEEHFKSQEAPNESVSSILQCMTSFPVSGAVLLSPLPSGLLNLIRKETLSLKSKPSKDSIPSADDSASILGKGKVSKQKITKSVGETEPMEESERKNGVHYKDNNNMTSPVEKNMEIETLERKPCFSSDSKVKLLSTSINDSGDSLKGADKDIPLKKRGVKKDWLKDGLMLTDFPKEESLDGRDGSRDEQRASRTSSMERIGKNGVKSSEKDSKRAGGRTKGNRVPTLFKPKPGVITTDKDSSSGPMNQLKQKVGPRDTQNEQDRIEQSQGAKKLSLEGQNKSKGRLSNSQSTPNLPDQSLRSGVGVIKSNKSAQKDVAKVRVSYDYVLDVRLPSGDRAEDHNHDTAKVKDATNDGTHTKGLCSETQLAPVAPVIIEENWVQCDSCEKWCLLPYGTKPDQLPDNWLCSMQDWLPGMNSCDVSQEETEKALRALYQSTGPTPESHKNYPQGTAVGVASANGQSLNQNYQNLGADAMPDRGKKKLKAKAIVNTSTNKKKPLLKTSLINNYTSQCLDKSLSLSVERWSDKQKEKHLDGALKRRNLKSKRDPDQNGHEASKRIKTNDAAVRYDKYFNSENGGVGPSSSTGLLMRITGRDLQRHGEPRYSKDGLLTSVRKTRDSMLGFPNRGSLETKTRNGRDFNAKKRKLKDWQENQNNLENGNSGEYRVEKKSRLSMSMTEGQESSTSRDDDRSNKKGKLPRILLSASRDNNSVGVKNGEKVAYHHITLDDIESLKKDLGSEQFSTGAVSSSSKVSDSHKRFSYKEVKGSPVESVSSSPLKTSNLRRDGSRKDCAKIGNSPSMEVPSAKDPSDSKNNHLLNGDDVMFPKKSGKGSSLQSKDKDKSCYSVKKVTVKFSDPSSEQEVNPKNNIQRDKMDIDRNLLGPHHEEIIGAKKHGGDGRTQVNSGHTSKQDPSSRVCEPIFEPLKGRGLDVQPVDAPKVFQQPGNLVHHYGSDQSVGQGLIGPNPVKGSQAATDILKEAEHLRNCAGHYKDSGFEFESNMEYFQAALKFLLGASLLESEYESSTKHGEMAQIQIYCTTAKLFETCAHEFEKREEMAAAALAYKCLEVACMRVVYCKSSSTNRDRHDLQASLQILPQGESPSSSASDVDNLNNQVMVDKAALSRTMGSNPGNHVIVARNRPNFVRLLDFTNEASAAMEASRKSQIAFAAAKVILEQAQNNEGVNSIKKVIDFSFQDVDELVRLVRFANEASK